MQSLVICHEGDSLISVCDDVFWLIISSEAYILIISIFGSVSKYV